VHKPFAVLLACLCLFAVSAALSGCFSPGEAEPLSLVPSNATSVSIAKVGELASDSDFRALYRAMYAGNDIDGHFSRIAGVAGADVRDAGDAVSFSLGIGRAGEATIMRASRSESDFGGASGPSGWERREYSGRTYYYAAANSTAAAFVQGNAVAGGEMAVKAVLAVDAGGDSLEKNARIEAILAKLPSDAPLRSASVSPASGAGEVSPFNYSSVFSAASGSGFAFRRNGANAELTLAVLYSTPVAALQAKPYAEAAITSLKGFAPPGGAVDSLLSGVACLNEAEFVACRASPTFGALESAVEEWNAAMAEQP